MVRHTKKQVLGGEEVLRLPSKTEETVAGEAGCAGGVLWVTDSEVVMPPNASECPQV